jgi:hypothetical protein
MLALSALYNPCLERISFWLEFLFKLVILSTIETLITESIVWDNSPSLPLTSITFSSMLTLTPSGTTIGLFPILDIIQLINIFNKHDI